MATFGTFVANQTLTAAELNTAGAWQAYTPTWTQGVAITKTVNWARFMQLNKLVTVNIKMTATSNGTSASDVLVDLPVNASSNQTIMGMAHLTTSGGTVAGAPVRLALYNSTSTIKFSSAGFTANVNLSNAYTTQILSGEVINVILTYEAA